MIYLRDSIEILFREGNSAITHIVGYNLALWSPTEKCLRLVTSPLYHFFLSHRPTNLFSEKWTRNKEVTKVPLSLSTLFLTLEPTQDEDILKARSYRVRNFLQEQYFRSKGERNDFIRGGAKSF